MTYELVTAVDDPSEPIARTGQTISLVDQSEWTDVATIEIEAKVSG
ncbi:hypothetical protein [Halopiger goleimassiliensis]|nr:hypothetical protein [Halopiger goleimassiliensis]